MNIDTKAKELSEQVFVKQAVREAIAVTFEKEALNPAVKSTLIGSLIGGVGGGVAGYLAPGDKEKERKRILTGIITGILGGGAIGYGVQKVKGSPALDRIKGTPVPKAESKVAPTKFPIQKGKLDTPSFAPTAIAAGIVGVAKLGTEAAAHLNDRAFVKALLKGSPDAKESLLETLKSGTGSKINMQHVDKLISEIKSKTTQMVSKPKLDAKAVSDRMQGGRRIGNAPKPKVMTPKMLMSHLKDIWTKPVKGADPASRMARTKALIGRAGKQFKARAAYSPIKGTPVEGGGTVNQRKWSPSVKMRSVVSQIKKPTGRAVKSVLKTNVRPAARGYQARVGKAPGKARKFGKGMGGPLVGVALAADLARIAFKKKFKDIGE